MSRLAAETLWVPKQIFPARQTSRRFPTSHGAASKGGGTVLLRISLACGTKARTSWHYNQTDVINLMLTRLRHVGGESVILTRRLISMLCSAPQQVSPHCSCGVFLRELTSTGELAL